MRLCGVISIVAALSGLAAMPAEAGTRIFFGYRPFYPAYGAYYVGPRYYAAPRYYYSPRYAYDYDDSDYYDDPDSDAPRVYRPQRQQPQQKKTRQKSFESDQALAPKATDLPASTAITCARATKIVSEYGFSAVQSTNCKGQIYSFKAVRDGKNFSIKLSAKNGELTEVKKL
jgi:hypothetical protein